MDVPDRVLVALDGSPLATDALDFALTIFPHAEIAVCNVVVPLDATMSEGGVLTDEAKAAADEHERAEAVVEAARRRADEHDATVRTTTETGRPAGTIVAYVEDHDVDHVVMGSHGRGDLS